MPDDIHILAESLRDGDAVEREKTAMLLASLGDLAQPAAVPLLLAVEDHSESVREHATAALESLGPPLPEDSSEIASHVLDDHPDVAYWSLTLLGRLRAEAGDFTPNIVRALSEHPELFVRERAAWCLGRIGPPAQSAIPELENAAQSESPRLASLAADALKSIVAE